MPTFEQLRWPVAIALVVIAAIVLWPRSGEADAAASPSPSVVVGAVGGEVTSTEPEATATPAATPIPTVTPPSEEPTAEPTPEPTEEPAADEPAPQPDGFTAQVFACRSISGSTCNGELGTLPPSAGAFTALVTFTDANGGDVMNAVLTGPSGTIDGFAYTLQGGGDGYYYTQFQAGGLPAGDYTLTATRNGQPVAVTSFRKAGN
jgi:hypothetical protein